MLFKSLSKFWVQTFKIIINVKILKTERNSNERKNSGTVIVINQADPAARANEFIEKFLNNANQRADKCYF
jgi:hypothetical protein